MTISAMGKKFVVLGLAMCLLLSSFHEVSCQVEGSSDLSSNDQESLSSKSESESKISFKKSSIRTEDETSSSVGVDNSNESGRLSDNDDRSSMMDQVKAMNKRAGRSDGFFGELGDDIKINSNGEIVLEESDRKLEGSESATEYVKELEISKEKSKVERRETKSGESIYAEDVEVSGDDITDDEDGKYQIYYGKNGEKKLTANKNSEFESKSHKIISEAASSREQYESKRSNRISGVVGSLGFVQSESEWRCYDQDKNGAKEDEDALIVIPKYEIDHIIKEESIHQGTESKASSLVAALTKIVETHKNIKWTSTVEIGKKTRKSSETVRLETVETLKVRLKKYQSLSVHELVDHPQFEEILATAAHYEEVSLAKVSHISRLSMYKSVIMEGRKASERVELASNHIKLHEQNVKDKQSDVDAEFASVKALAQRGDILKVKIFAIKKLVLRLEAEKEEVDINFQKTVGNLSRLLEEASQAEEKYQLVVRKWKEEKASAEFSQEAIQNAKVVWVQFLSTLKTTTTTTTTTTNTTN